MFDQCEMIAFTQTMQPEKAKHFFGKVIGLKFEHETPAAIVYSAGKTMVRVQKVREFTPLPFTSLGWKVPDVTLAVRYLTSRGVRFERYQGMPQDDLGIWTSPDGGNICWFKDPDGNTISLSQFSTKSDVVPKKPKGRLF